MTEHKIQRQCQKDIRMIDDILQIIFQLIGKYKNSKFKAMIYRNLKSNKQFQWRAPQKV